jgi:hypothetical protein
VLQFCIVEAALMAFVNTVINCWLPIHENFLIKWTGVSCVRKGLIPWDWLCYGHEKKSHGLITRSTPLTHHSYDSFRWHQYEWIYSSQDYIYVVIYFSVIRKIYLEEKIPSFYKKFKTYLSLVLTYHLLQT